MRLPSRRPTALFGSLSVIAALSLSACGSDDTSEPLSEPLESSSSAAPEETSEPTEPEETDESSEPADGDEATGGGAQPSWAEPLVTAGDLLTTIEAGDVTVEAYQVSTTKADDTGSFADPDTNKPLIEVGDTLVFVNYVITNNGDPIDLGFSLVGVDARYDDWPYLGGMDGLSSSDLYESQGLDDFGVAVGSDIDSGVFTLGTGESFSYAENFEYQKDSPITFDVSYTPVDADGELLSDDRVEAEGSAVIS